MRAKILKKGQNIDFATHPITNKTKLFIKNRSLRDRSQARLKVGWTPAETVDIDPNGTLLIERNWAGLVGNIFNVGQNEIEVWVV